MELKGRDLKQGLRGDDVALLHSELAIIGLTVPDAERRDTLFGQGTHEAVAQFQKQHCLEPTGVVDAQTARAINAAVNAMTFTVQGNVVSRLRAGVGGLRVEIVDKNVCNSPKQEPTTKADIAPHSTLRICSNAASGGPTCKRAYL
jgi:peptidoglycan hydrolase-like protein with peptidoglycan-binding domain